MFPRKEAHFSSPSFAIDMTAPYSGAERSFSLIRAISSGEKPKIGDIITHMSGISSRGLLITLRKERMTLASSVSRSPPSVEIHEGMLLRSSASV